MNNFLAAPIFALGLFCRLVYLVTGLALVGIGMAVLWWMSRECLGIQAIDAYVGEETFRLYIQPGPMLPMPWHFETWSDWFWGIYRFGFLLQFAFYATIASMFIGGLSFLARIPVIPYQVAIGEKFTWDDGDDNEGSGLNMAFGPAFMVIGAVAATALINTAMVVVAKLWIGDVPVGDDWAMAVTIQSSLPYVGWIGLIAFIAVYTFFYGCLSWLAAIGATMIVVVQSVSWMLGLFGVTDPNTVFLTFAVPVYSVVCLTSVAAMFTSPA